jgi:hypothetical protein
MGQTLSEPVVEKVLKSNLLNDVTSIAPLPYPITSLFPERVPDDLIK